MPPSNPPGSARHASTTAPAGSREPQGRRLHAAEQRCRLSQLVARSVELGRPMRRADARRVVLAYANAFDGHADGWNTWLSHRFNPTRDAAIANLAGGPHG